MEHLTPNERLDFVLNYLKEKNTKVLITEIIVTMKNSKLINDNSELFVILNRLEDDKHIISIETSGQETGYIITENGKEFEGYVAERVKVASESVRLEKLESDQMAIQKSMARLTRWIAVGTVAAALFALALLAWQVYSFYHPLPPPCDVR